MRIFLFFFFSILFSLVTKDLSAETMRGGSYTLNGSVDVMIGQGEGGVYGLNLTGDGSVSNLTGGTFALYPTPYSKPAPIIAEVIRLATSATFGTGVSTPYYTNGTTTTVDDPAYPQNTLGNTSADSGDVGIDGGNSSGYYNEDGQFIPSNTKSRYNYSDQRFGASNRVGNQEQISGSLKLITSHSLFIFFIWIISLLLILYILKRIWGRINKNRESHEDKDAMY